MAKTLSILRHPETKQVVLTFSPLSLDRKKGRHGMKFQKLVDKGFVYIGNVRGWNLAGARTF